MSLPGSLAVTPKVSAVPSSPFGAVIAEMVGATLAMVTWAVFESVPPLPSLTVTVTV